MTDEEYCPVCGSRANALDPTGDARQYDCPQHGKFKVANSPIGGGRTAQEWQAAFERAKGRAKPNELPTITGYDFP